MSRTLSGHASPRDLMKLLLYERNQAAEGGLVALAPSEKQSGGLGWVVRDAAILSLFAMVHRFHRHFPLLKQEKSAGFVVDDLREHGRGARRQRCSYSPVVPASQIDGPCGWSQRRCGAMCSHPQHFRGDIS
jgi:hypothetical protein